MRATGGVWTISEPPRHIGFSQAREKFETRVGELAQGVLVRPTATPPRAARQPMIGTRRKRVIKT